MNAPGNLIANLTRSCVARFAVALAAGLPAAIVWQSSANAQTLYEQPTAAFMNVWSYSGQQLADDFVLTSGGTVATVRWKGGYCCWNSSADTTSNTGTFESFTVNFFTNVGSLPSAIPFYSITGNATVVSSPNSIPGNYGPLPGFEYSLSVGGVALSAATTYWISIYTNDFPKSFAWATSAEGNNGRAYNAYGNWNSFFGDQVFSLEGGQQVTPVPEPETYAQLIAGLAVLGFAARRRRKRQAVAIV